MRHLSYRGTRFSVLCWYLSVPHLMLSAVLPQQFPPRYHIENCGRQYSTSTLIRMLVPQPGIYSRRTSGMHKSPTTKCSTVAPDIHISSVQNLLHMALMASTRFLMRQNLLTPGASIFVKQFAPRRHARIFWPPSNEGLYSDAWRKQRTAFASAVNRACQ
jgi:hypothetical protein